jgi:pimeloyl-ACP methyl ester carboxylesterase
MGKVKAQEILAGEHAWFYRESLPLGEPIGLPVILLHGLVSQSYSWREVLPALSAQGFRAIAPDWLGGGYSEKPDRLDFAYSPQVLMQELGKFLAALEIETCTIVAQGFLGHLGIQYALEHPEQVDRLAIFNAPIFRSAKLPWKIQQIGLPLIGDAFAQDFLLVDRILEGGGGYRVEDQDMDLYRRPWIQDGDAGRALNATLSKMGLAQASQVIETGLTQWRKPVLIGWGMRDPWLSALEAEAIAQRIPNAKFVKLEEVGHYVQEDWHEKVSEELLLFLRQQNIS